MSSFSSVVIGWFQCSYAESLGSFIGFGIDSTKTDV